MNGTGEPRRRDSRSTPVGERLRVLWLSHSSQPGGAENSLAEGVTALSRRGVEVHVVLPRDGPLADRLTAADRVHHAATSPWMSSRRSPVAAVRRLAYNLVRGNSRLDRVLSDVRPDVVVSNTLLVCAGAFAARRFALPHVWWLHEFGDLDHGLSFDWGRRPTLRLVDRLSRRVLVNSETLRTHYSRWIPAERLRVVYYAVCTPDLDVAERQPGGPLRLVFVGQRTPGKRPEEAVRALALLRARGVEARLRCIGSSRPDRDERLRELARDLGVEGDLSLEPFTEDPFQAVREADVLLICSRNEAFGRVTVEAMKLGVPVVGAAAGATVELVVHGETGRLYRPGDAADCAEQVAVLARRPEVRSRIGETARRWARASFSLDQLGEDLVEALGESVHPRARR